MLIILLDILNFSRYIMKERHQKVELWTSQKPKKEARLETWVNPCPRSHQERKKDGISTSWKMFELLTPCSNQNMNNVCQHFGNTRMIVAKLRNYNDTIRCDIQNEIMSVFLNANGGFHERYHHTHQQPITPPQAYFPSGPSKKYSQSINPPPHTSLSSLCSQNPSLSCSGNNSPSPFSQYNNSLLFHNFPTESISPATTSSEENTQVSVE